MLEPTTAQKMRACTRAKVYGARKGPFHARCPAFERSRTLASASRGIPCLGRADERRNSQADNARDRGRLRRACRESGDTRRGGDEGELMLQQCRLLGLANPLARFGS